MSRWHTYSSPKKAFYRLVVASLVFGACFALVGTTRNTAAATNTLTRVVTASADDGRSKVDGNYTSTEAVAAIGAGNGSQGNVFGARFNSVSIPTGATISAVRFTMVKHGTTWHSTV